MKSGYGSMPAAHRTLADVARDIRDRDLALMLKTWGVEKRGRMWKCPIHRDENPSASVHRGRLHCFVCGEHWSSIDLVMKLESVDFPAAVHRLAEFYGIPGPEQREWSETERQEWRRRLRVAEREADKVAEWRDGLIEGWRDRRNDAMAAYHRALQHIIRCGQWNRCCQFAADVADVYGPRFEELDRKIDLLAGASADDLLQAYWQTRGNAFT